MSLTLSAEPEELKNRFLALKTVKDIADLLEIDRNHLNYHLYISPPSKRYTTFDIPKKSGGTRRISTPVTALKIIQRKLNQILQHVYKPKPSVHSFVLGQSILTNARAHLRHKYVLNVDLRDFFPSINFGRVRGLFMANPYKLNPTVATVLSQICCFDGKLPQGAPTSPIVSNMICAKMDNELYRLAKNHKCSYTRYADDITFSTFEHDFPSALARINPLEQVEVGDEFNRVIHENGFEVNPNKVRLRKKNLRQEVTGLTVNNESPNVKRRYVRQIRAMLHAWERYGLKDAEGEFLKRHDKKHRGPFKKPLSFIQVVKGKIEFLGMVIGKEHPVYLRYYHQFRRLCLLKIYDDLAKSQDHQRRGYLLENLLNQMFELYQIPATKSFRRNENREQIDGGFQLADSSYIAEFRWRRDPANREQVDAFYTKVCRSGRQTMGFFLSINGWSVNVVPLLKQNPQKCIMLMNGSDLHSVLSDRIDLGKFINAKMKHLNYKTEPYYGAEEYLKAHNKT